MKKILTDAAAVGNAAGRMLNWRYAVSHPDWAYYPGSKWGNMLWEGGADLRDAAAGVHPGRHVQAVPADRRPHARLAHGVLLRATRIDSPGMIMRIPDIGSQYLMGFLDADGNPFDGGKTYKVTLPKDIPARAFWSFTVYDNQSRSMLDTPQRYPRAGSQSYPSPAAEAERRRLDDGLLRPDAARRRQARQLDPDDARQGLVHDPAPLQPARAVLRQELAAERDRAREIAHHQRTLPSSGTVSVGWRHDFGAARELRQRR